MPENKVAIEMDEDKNIKPEGFNDKALENHSYVWSEYVRVPALTLDYSTIKRARQAGIGDLLQELSRDVLAALQRLGIRVQRLTLRLRWTAPKMDHKNKSCSISGNCMRLSYDPIKPYRPASYD